MEELNYPSERLPLSLSRSLLSSLSAGQPLMQIELLDSISNVHGSSLA